MKNETHPLADALHSLPSKSPFLATTEKAAPASAEPGGERTPGKTPLSVAQPNRIPPQAGPANDPLTSAATAIATETDTIKFREAALKAPVPASNGSTTPENHQPKPTTHFKCGDWIEVRPLEEILATLDHRGAHEGLVFMPEMAQYCLHYFRVSRRVEQLCMDAGTPLSGGGCMTREFDHNNVILLEGLRCPGTAHGDCSRGCMLFWKESWLTPSRGRIPLHESPTVAVDSLPSLRPTTETGRYFCQSSEILLATHPLQGLRRPGKCVASVRAGNYGWFEMFRMILTWIGCRVHRRIFGVFPRGTQKSTPVEELHLHPGELVEVKSLQEIIGTLDRGGRNRGLHFSRDMVPFCGQRIRVKARAEKLIGEGTGLMRQLKNTVILAGVVCDSSTYAFGGCPRDDFQYWREIWLKRVPGSQVSTFAAGGNGVGVRTEIRGGRQE